MNLTKKLKMERVTLILKPNIINELRSLLPNLTLWLTRRKVTPCFLNHEKARIEKIFSKIPSKINFLSLDEAQKKSDLIITLEEMEP